MAQSFDEPMASTPSGEQPLQFFEMVSGCFEQAKASCGGVIERFYRIGGYCVRLQFVGEALVEYLTAAFAHLSIPAQESFELTVGLWDGRSTGAYLPPLPFSQEDYLPRCGVRNYVDTRIQVSFEGVSNILSVLDTETNAGYFWISDAADIPFYHGRSPLLLLLHQWMSLHDRTLVHGGAVGTKEGGVLLVGKSGSGKSTTALCCLDSSLLYASDDYGLVENAPEPYFHSIYSSGKILAPDTDKHAFLSREEYKIVPDLQEAVYFLHPHFPDKLSAGFPLRAIVVPRVTGQRDTYVRPTSAAKAMLALAPSTLLQLPGAETRKFAEMARLAKSLPAYSLEAGTDWSQIPRALEALVGELNAKAKQRG